MIPARPYLLRLALLLVVAIVTLGLGLGAGAAERRPKFDTWLSGADGMLAAMQKASDEKLPLLVYFYTDWCPYCRQFEGVLLSEDYVEEYLDGIIKVRINPEAGQFDRAIARQYGVSGYPAVFLHSARSKQLSRIERMQVVDGRPRLLSPEEFVATLVEAAGR